MLEAAPHRGSQHDFLVLGRCVLGTSNSTELPDASLFERDGIAVAFAGVLDNLEDLRIRFRDPLSEDETVTPAKVVASVFRRLRDDTPAALRGMYAAVITDGSTVWCFRDHIAFGQLFYRLDPQGLYAATEAKQVLAGTRLSMEPDIEVVERMFYADVDDDTPCAVKGVDRLPKATLLVSDGQRSRRRRYWDPQALVETARPTMDEIRERFDQLMTQAVARQITGSDVVSLSGGIDSPTVAVYAAPLSEECYGHPMGALSEVYPDYPAVDESTYIKVVAEQLGIQSHTFVPESRPLDDILEWVRLCDGPIPVHPPSESAEFYRLARKLGYQTVLGGDLAEFVIDRKYGVLSHLLIRGRFRGLWKQVRDERIYGHSWGGIIRQLASTFAPRALLVARERRRPPSPLFPDWLDIRILNEINTRWIHAPRERWRKEQVAFFVGPGIGLEADEIIGAVCGVRPRRPWIDVDLCEFFLSLPAEVKFPAYRSKSLVRSLLRGKVPDVILDRTDKTYFNERLLARIDYPALCHWLMNPKDRIRGVNYQMLADRLERKDLGNIGDYKWAIDLAKSHAFLSQW